VTVTVEDKTAPTVSGVSPAPGATKVERNICPIVTFSEKLDPTTLTSSTFMLVKYGTTTPISTRMELYDWPNQTGASLCPSSNLAARTKYTVKLTSSVKDLAGNALVAYSWSFTTGSQ
jgi:hypothetical protein